MDPSGDPTLQTSLIALKAALARQDHAEAVEAKLRLMDLVVLRCVATHDNASAIHVARTVGLRPSSLTGILDRLEKQALLTRVRSQTDRRRTELVITEEGAARLPTPWHERLLDALAQSPAEERDALTRAVARLVAQLAELDEP